MEESHDLPIISFVTLKNYLLSLNFNSAIFKLGGITALKILELSVFLFVKLSEQCLVCSK